MNIHITFVSVVLAGASLLADDPAQGLHLKWTFGSVSETTPSGDRTVDLVSIFYDGQRVGILDPRNLPIVLSDDIMDNISCADNDLDCYPPGVTSGAIVLALSPEENRLIFYVEMGHDNLTKYLLYFNIPSKTVIPMGIIGADTLTNFTFSSDSSYAYMNSDFWFEVMNFKTNTISEIPQHIDMLGDANVPPDWIDLSHVSWIAPNTLSFSFTQQICQNPEPDIEISNRVYIALPTKTCTYNFDTGETRITKAKQSKKGNVGSKKTSIPGNRP